MGLSRKNLPFYLLFGLILLVGTCVTLTTGATPWPEVWKGVLGHFSGDSMGWNPLLDERLPRLIVLLCTGASLAVSGAILQSLFHNPLASPSVLGISCGGCLMVTMVFILEWHFHYPYAVPLAAFAGCLLTLLLVYGLSYRKGGVQIAALVLTGIAISSVLLAIQGAISYALRDRWEIIQTITEWEAGSASDRSWKHVHMQLPLTIVGLAGSWIYCKEINILALGDEEATNLGVEVAKVRWRLFLCVALLTGGAIAAMGIIAFFGLVLPHLIRKITGPDNQRLIPLTILAGSATLLALDLFLRTFGIRALTIGNISAILGGIFFLLMLFGFRRESGLMRASSC